MRRLEVEGLNARYGLSHVLHGVDLVVAQGEVVCVLGRNGVGKSTTVKTLMGLVRASGGSARLDGVEITGLPPHRIARLGLGWVPEERRVFPTITVRENLLMGIKRPACGGPPRWTMERVFACFPRLAERAGQRAGTLSGGEQQMLSLGRTLMGNPDIALIDEPTEGLAPLIVERVEQLIEEMRRDGMGVLLVEQSLETAMRFADRVYVMAKGATVFSGRREELAAALEVRKANLEI